MATNNVDGEIIYSDVNLDLGAASSYELLYNGDAVMRSILTILTTRRGTRPFRRTFGSSLMELLFDPLDDVTAKRIRTQLLRDIAANEPRVAIQEVEVLPDNGIDGYYINIVGWMVRLNNQPLSFNFNLKRKVS